MDLNPKVVKKRVFKPDIYKRLITSTMLRALPPFLNKNKIALDIGGNTGHIAYFIADYCSTVYTYEAIDIVYKQLKKIETQKSNVKAFNVAVSDFCGESKFFVDDKRLSNSSFQNLVNGQETTVKVITIDSLNLDNIGFIKIDVEGTEYDVIKGAEKTINKCRPNCMVEIYNPYSKYPLNKIFDFMFEREYLCYYYDHSTPGLVAIKDSNAGVYAVENKHKIHDGDFLFVSNN